MVAPLFEIEMMHSMVTVEVPHEYEFQPVITQTSKVKVEKRLTQSRHMMVMPMLKPHVMRVVAMSELWMFAKM